MKKIIHYFLLIIFVFSFSLTVFAQDYELNQLIPVDTAATVKTEKFNYIDFVYKSQVNGKGNASIHFNKIVNNSITKVPVSINILLFDEAQKNVGFLTYCSDKDVSSNYAGAKINGNQGIEFSINVTSKYFVEGKLPKDVKYIAVMDDNKYCQIGGYTKYDGMTIEQITNGEDNPNKTSEEKLKELMPFLRDKALMILAITIGSLIAAFLILGAILNALHRKMYAKTTVLAYLPITNNYICVKMAFGKIVAIVFIIVNLMSSLLFVMGIGIINTLVSLVSIVAFVVDIIKLITKKYDLLYFEPSIQNPVNNNFNMNNFNNNNNFDNNNNFNNNQGQQTIDLNYNQPVDFSGSSDNFTISSGESRMQEASLDDGEDINNNANNMNNNNNNNSDNNGESDLSKFFN